MSASSPRLVGVELARFLQSGLSITVAGRNERLVPSIAKAAGCRVDDDGREVSVFVFAEPAEPVCKDVAANGLVAACFNRPSTHETVQLKGRDARSAIATAADIAAARRCLDLLIADLAKIGFDPTMIEAHFWRERADLLAIRFTPDAAFAQTPGPSAGKPLDSASI